MPVFEPDTTYNLIRIDIGGGAITFILNGQQIDVHNSLNGESNGMNTNSVYLVDEAFLSQPYYISRDNQGYIQNDEPCPVDILQDDYPVIEHILKNNPANGGSMDGDGGLFIPYTPYDVSNLQEGETVSVNFAWDMANSIYLFNGTYYMTDRIEGTCFDFNVAMGGVTLPSE